MWSDAPLPHQPDTGWEMLYLEKDLQSPAHPEKRRVEMGTEEKRRGYSLFLIQPKHMAASMIQESLVRKAISALGVVLVEKQRKD